MTNPILSLSPTTKIEPREVVRLVTTCWRDKRGLHIRKSLRAMKRLSVGSYRFLEEDCDMIGADQVVSSIVNLHECKDGLYTVTTCDELRDWETGFIDGYDYRLISFDPTAMPTNKPQLETMA